MTIKPNLINEVTKADHLSSTDDIRITRVEEMISPEKLVREISLSEESLNLISHSRDEIRRCLHGMDDRLVVIVGPCSIHDPEAGKEYAGYLAQAKEKWAKDLLLVMRVYFEKPRTTVGWKGLINDPYIDCSFRINDGLRLARHFLVDVIEAGLPPAVEFLDLITPQYLADAVAWGAIGARTTESQGHRELGSGLSCPIGYKNGTTGNIQIAVDAVKSANQPHRFISIKKDGGVAIFETRGNTDAHIILRGGKEPNFDARNVEFACRLIKKAGLEQRLMIDCSHGNSKKDFNKQPEVARDIAEQISSGESRIFGVMLESHLVEGRQEYRVNGSNVYGQSITDACISWQTTEEVLAELAQAVRERRRKP